jgi:hypothetical protein
MKDLLYVAFFASFFFTRQYQTGHGDPNVEDKYCYIRVLVLRRTGKKFQGRKIAGEINSSNSIAKKLSATTLDSQIHIYQGNVPS